MITKYISSKTVLAKVFADLNLQEDGNRVTDMMEWIGEAMEHIGAVKQLIRKVSGTNGDPIITICNHLATLPCDLYRLNQVAFSISTDGPWHPMRLAIGSFDNWSSDQENCDCDIDLLSVPDRVMVDIIRQLYLEFPNDPVFGSINTMPYREALRLINTEHRTRRLVTGLMTRGGYITNYRQRQTNFSHDLQYILKPGFISTLPRMGFLKLSYDAIHTDKDGYPMIPDLPSYIEAIYWYVTMKLKYPDYLNGKMNREIYYDIRRSWNFYAKQAYAEAMMPNLDEMESFKNTWNRIYPELKEHDNFYSTVGQQQHINTHTNSRYKYGWF